MSNYLKKRREDLNLSQRDVANKVGVSAATVSRWEAVTLRICAGIELQHMQKHCMHPPLLS